MGESGLVLGNIASLGSTELIKGNSLNAQTWMGQCSHAMFSWGYMVQQPPYFLSFSFQPSMNIGSDNSLSVAAFNSLSVAAFNMDPGQNPFALRIACQFSGNALFSEPESGTRSLLQCLRGSNSLHRFSRHLLYLIATLWLCWNSPTLIDFLK